MRTAFAPALVLWVLSSTAFGQNAPPVTIDLAKTADLTVERNLTIKAAQQDITTATKGADRIRGEGKGRVDANAAYYRLDTPITLQSRTVVLNGTPVTIPGQTVANQDVYLASVTGSYHLFDAGRISYGVKSADYKISEAKNDTSDTQLSVVLQTTRTYLAAIYGRENVRVNEESLKSYEQHLDQAQKSRKEGMATDYDVTRAQSAVEDQKKRLVEVQNQYELALANLRTALLLGKETPIDLRGNFFDIPAPQPVSQAEENTVKSNPLLKGIADQSSSLRMAEKAIKAEWWPQLDAVGYASLINRQSGFSTNAQWFVGVQLSQVIFDGGVIKARAAEMRSDRDKTNIELSNTGDDLKLSVRSAYLDMSTARSAIDASRKSVELAKESLRLAERRFAEGVGTSLEVLDANVNLLSAETGLEQSFYQLDNAYLTIHRYLGDVVQVAQTAQSAQGSRS